MGLLRKTLAELVERAKHKEEKIAERIEAKKQEISNHNKLVIQKTQSLAELEVEGDETGINTCLKEIRNHREKIEDAESFLKAYESLDSSMILTSEDIAKIRKAAAKEREERFARSRAHLDESKAIRAQIIELQKKDKEVLSKWNYEKDNVTEISALMRVMHLIDPKYNKVDNLFKDRFIANWIEGNEDNINSYLDR